MKEEEKEKMQQNIAETNAKGITMEKKRRLRMNCNVFKKTLFNKQHNRVKLQKTQSQTSGT